MSKHWNPDEDRVQPLPKGRRLKSLDEFTLPEFVGRMNRVRRLRRELPQGAVAGLVIVAAACVGVAVGLYAALGPIEVVLEDVGRSAALE